MMEKNIVYSCLGIFLLLNIVGKAQEYDPLHPPNTFQNSDNPYYWKNDPPHPGYWQQDVHYEIQAKIDEKKHLIDGQQTLTYWNNSPDTLTKVYFRLIQNAFQPGSYYTNLWKNNNRKPKFGEYEKQGLGTEIISLRVNGKKVDTQLDNTILQVQLPEPLPPGESVKFEMEFKTYWDSGGNMRRRMHMFNVLTVDTFGEEQKAQLFKTYNGVSWYPRIACYGRKFGWVTDQHLDKEWYKDFGTFDVELTFPSNFVVEATGNLLNRNEVLPHKLRQKLALDNYVDNPGYPTYSVVPYDPEKTKTWEFHAENVHDFAFTASPNYRIDSAGFTATDPQGQTKTVSVYAVAQERKANRWHNAAEYTAKIMKVFSEDFGMYPYHKMVMADARDGMEYPMLTLDGGGDPSYRDLLAHEAAHNWFFGMLGTNELYQAAMDEGFTQFSTVHAMNKVDGKYYESREPGKWYRRMFDKPNRIKYGELYLGYIWNMHRGRDHKLNTHSSDFHGALRHGGGYGNVYYKMGVMLYNLEYVLGEELFMDMLQHYVDQWAMAHPYFEDFRKSAVQYTDVDLNWFFDQWFTTTKKLDYAVKSVKKGNENNEYIITFERKEEMQMPIDFTVTDQNGKKHKFHIPNTWFVKETDAKVLPKWYGWGKRLNTTYEAEVKIPAGIKNVQIDPTHRLADVNWLNNSKKFPIDLEFEAELRERPEWHEYDINWRPDLWYNSFDGIKPGIHLNGNYMRNQHDFHLTAWYNSGFVQGGVSRESFGDLSEKHDPFSFIARYQTALQKYGKRLDFSLEGRSLAGLNSGKIGLVKELSDPFAQDKDEVYTTFESMYRPQAVDYRYLLYPDEWGGVTQFNNTLSVGYRHEYNYIDGQGNIDISVNSSSLFSDYDYSHLSMEVQNETNLGKLDLRTRVYGRLGTGQNVPPESALFMSGANPKELMTNKYTRARGFFPNQWVGQYGATTNHFHYGGGLNLRGYSGYLVAQRTDEGSPIFVYKGRSGASVNAELEFDDLVDFHPSFLRAFHLDTYLFGDAGAISYTDPDGKKALSEIRVDAGIGTALKIRKFGPLQTVKPLVIRFDVPLFLNRPPAGTDFLEPRWVLGVERAF